MHNALFEIMHGEKKVSRLYCNLYILNQINPQTIYVS